VPETVWRGWLSGIDLKRRSSGEVTGLVVGQDGTFGHIVDDTINW
jgi:hypothetical protein